MPSIKKALAKNLRTFRKSKHLSQSELARKIGVSRQTIVNYETEMGGVSLETISKLARVLEVSETDLVRDPTEQPKPVIIRPTVNEALGLIRDAISKKKTSPNKN